MILFALATPMAALDGMSSPPVSIGLFAGPSVAVPLTWTAEDPALPHFGWGLGGGAELRLKSVIAARLDFGFLWIGQSAVSPIGILYRAWDGLRFSLSAGYSFDLGSLFLDVLAGGALTAARYRDTSLVFAYPSIIAAAGLGIPIGARGELRLSLPLELILRADSTTLSPGLSAAYAYSFPIGDAR